MEDTESHKIFLLGGYDLEMLTIKRMLMDRRDCVVIDKHLRWDNALLSAYKSELEDYDDSPIYGIELKEDIPVPSKYIRIDHHNDLNGNPSALEQVTEILGVELSRYQQLVAANDKGYIPAMEAMGATETEIENIRMTDRVAQGIGPDDEQLAMKSIRESLSKHQSLFVVKSQTPYFSTICDRMYPYGNLLIYTDSEWTFYGEDKEKILHLLTNDILQHKIFHGGGNQGYIGSVKHAYSKDEIQQFVEQVKKMYE